MAVQPAAYRPRNPQATDYYRCVEDHLESFLHGYEERFGRAHGFFRPYLREVICRYLNCGNLRSGFARVKCRDCNHEYLLAFSCERRHFWRDLSPPVVYLPQPDRRLSAVTASAGPGSRSLFPPSAGAAAG
ncbi:MAG: transposase zinc-binding domain-containing protein [Proteobacteria bacterium]|nr:transposase zinc-binding domain-containing protein [Pseudomonadota bacterium]